MNSNEEKNIALTTQERPMDTPKPARVLEPSKQRTDVIADPIPRYIRLLKNSIFGVGIGRDLL